MSTFKKLTDVEKHLRREVAEMTDGDITFQQIQMCRQDIKNIQGFYYTLDGILKELGDDYRYVKK